MPALLGISPKNVVDNVITALTSDGMVAPSFWVDPKTGNSYMLTVQYPEITNPNADRLQTDSAALGKQCQHNSAGIGGRHPDNQYSDGSRSLPTSPRV